MCKTQMTQAFPLAVSPGPPELDEGQPLIPGVSLHSRTHSVMKTGGLPAGRRGLLRQRDPHRVRPGGHVSYVVAVTHSPALVISGPHFLKVITLPGGVCSAEKGKRRGVCSRLPAWPALTRCSLSLCSQSSRWPSSCLIPGTPPTTASRPRDAATLRSPTRPSTVKVSAAGPPGRAQPQLLLRRVGSWHLAEALPVGLTCSCGSGSVLGTQSASWEAPEMFTHKLTPSPLHPNEPELGCRRGTCISDSTESVPGIPGSSPGSATHWP